VRTVALELLGQYEDHAAAISLLEQVLHPSPAGEINTYSLFGLHGTLFLEIVELVTAITNAAKKVGPEFSLPPIIYLNSVFCSRKLRGTKVDNAGSTSDTSANTTARKRASLCILTKHLA